MSDKFRWLLVHNRPDEAKRALQIIRGTSLTPEYFEEEFVEMTRGIEEEKELASAGSFYDMFKGTDLRRSIICFGTILSHAAAGLWLIIGYGVGVLPKIIVLPPNMCLDVLFPNSWYQEALRSIHHLDLRKFRWCFDRPLLHNQGDWEKNFNAVWLCNGFALHVGHWHCKYRGWEFTTGRSSNRRIHGAVRFLLQRLFRHFELAHRYRGCELAAPCYHHWRGNWHQLLL